MRVGTVLAFLVALLFSFDQACLGATAPPRSDQGPAPPLGPFVLYAQHSIQLSADEKIRGEVGVHAAALGVKGSQLAVGSSTRIVGDLYSPSTEIANGITFTRLFTNQLTTSGAPQNPSPFPAVNLPALPYLAVPAAAGNVAVDVAASRTADLIPGTYGALSVAGTVRLVPGEYVFSKVTLAASAQLIADVGNGTGKVTIDVLGDFDAQGANIVKPLLSTTKSPATAAHLVIFVYGGMKPFAGTRMMEAATAHIGEKSDVAALLAAPHGTLNIDNDVTAKGAFAAFDIEVGKTSVITFQDGFPDSWGKQTGSQALTGYLPAHPDNWPITGSVPLDTQMSLSIGLPVATPKGFPSLKDFITQVSDPKQPSTFRHFLSQTQFTARYGASRADYEQLESWARAAGLSISAFPNNLLLGVSGTAAQFERAFNVFLLFRQRADGSPFVSVDRNPSLNLKVPVLDIGGLSSYVVQGGLSPGINGSGSGGNYDAADLNAAYLGGVCTALTGSGQTVGLLEDADYVRTDVQLFDMANGITAPLPAIVLQQGGNPNSAAPLEATLDVDMVEAMAPSANILVFQGSGGITANLDGALNAMATSITPLTVASSSILYKHDSSEQQALDEMAAQGTSFLQGSGDSGDIGDPQDMEDMDNQTLVGGTILLTNPLTKSSPPYPAPYYASETAWGGSGGGVMNGHVKGGVCYFCEGPVPIPEYQIATQQQFAASNGGSTVYRNYPDVAWTAANVDIFVGGQHAPQSGTSASTPLWAGFTALANEQQSKNDFGNTMGFLNPAIYDIGQTRGTAGDLYSANFHDISDGSTNANKFSPGFNAVTGYDLVTGWGTPTCGLLQQLANTPLLVAPPLVEIEFVIGTGGDKLESFSEVDADILLPDGVTKLHEVVHPQNTGTWETWNSNNGGQPVTIGGFQVPFPGPQITQTNPIKSVTLTLVQHNGFPHSANNWDMTSLTVNAYSGNTQRVCQLKLVGTSKLDDSKIGLFRFKKNFDKDCTTPGGMLCGPSHTFVASGC